MGVDICLQVGATNVVKIELARFGCYHLRKRMLKVYPIWTLLAKKLELITLYCNKWILSRYLQLRLTQCISMIGELRLAKCQYRKCEDKTNDKNSHS